ncbi:PAS domain-containing protein [Phenylobacterium terrae]|uniref:histidine kinase n=1 Tax=Phenylobacterium terrae TaxID=2665495 RepID=A0ABW4N5I9_9CAUL
MHGTTNAGQRPGGVAGPPRPEELAYRLHQQSVLAEFGRQALEASTLDELLNAAVRWCAEGMHARFCKALEFLPARNNLLLRAGVGWRPGFVGHELLGLDTPAGFAFRTGGPIVSEQFADEERFRPSRLMVEHGVKRVVIVPVPLGAGRRWGALGADSADDSGRWDEADVEFMIGMAQLLGVAIERLEAKREVEGGRALLTTIVDTVDQIIWAARPDGYHDFFNQRWYEFTGAEPGSTQGDTWAQMFHPDDRARTFERWRHSLETGEPYEIEYRLRHRSGAYRWVLGRAHPVRNEAGEIVRWFGTCTDIQTQKEYGERFRLLYQAQRTAHLVLAPDFTIEEASPSYLEATMTRREDLVGRPLFEAFPDNPDDPEATGVRNLRASLERVLARRAADRMPVQKYDIRRPNGEFEVRWWAPLNTPVFGPDGEVRHIIHQVEDVTGEMLERQRAAEAVAGETRLRLLADAIPGLVFEFDTEGRNTYVNRQYRDYTGLPPESLLGDGWRQVLHPEDSEAVGKAWSEAVHAARPMQVECRIRGADGAWRWFMLRAAPLQDREGRVHRAIGVCTDIDAARRARDALAESEEQFRSMADSLPQLAWMADAKGWIYWYNRRWYEYTGATLEEMQGWGWTKVHHPEHVDRVVERIQQAWDTGEPWEDVFPLRGADGRYRWFLSRAEPLRDAEGRVIRWFGTNTDITEKQRLEDLQTTLIQEISHRVKNSLALVSSLLALQARTLEGAPRKALEEAATRVHAIAGVHDQLWRQADAREVDLGPFIENLAAAVAATSPQHRTSVDAEPAAISADLAAPVGLLLNELLTNAYKYAYPEGAAGEVRVRGALAGDGRYRLEVADFGRGLPPDFDIASASRSLGMRVITSMAAQLDGRIEAASASPGARFTLTFPLKRA